MSELRNAYDPVNRALRVTGAGGGGGASAFVDLTDVDMTGVADGDAFVWDAGTSTLVPVAVPSSTAQAGVDDVWTIDGVAGAAIDADAGMYELWSSIIGLEVTDPITITVGDSEATIQSAFDALAGSGNITVAGNWADLTLTFHTPDGTGYGGGLFLNTHTLTKGGNAVADPTVTNTTPGHSSNTLIAGPVGNVLGRATDDGLLDKPTRYDPDSVGWNQAGYILTNWEPGRATELMGFGPGDRTDQQRAVGVQNGKRFVQSNEQVYSDTANENIGVFRRVELGPDGTSRLAHFWIERDYDTVFDIQVTDASVKLTLKAVTGQTGPVFEVQNSSGTPTFTVNPDGTTGP